MLILIGIGGAGATITDNFYDKNVVSKLIRKIHSKNQGQYHGIAVDTSDDVKRLPNVPAGNIVLIGKSRVKGHGTGRDVSLGKRIAKEELGLVTNTLSNIVTEKPWGAVLISGLGGGTGTGGFPVIAKKVRSIYKCKTLGVLILPSLGEGRVYSKNAFKNLETCLSSVEGAIILDNNTLTDRGEDILSARKMINRDIRSFFRLVDEGFFERCMDNRSTIAFYKSNSSRISVKEIMERMLRDRVFLKFNIEKSKKIIFIAKGNLSSLYGHDFAQGWVKSKFDVHLEYEFYDEPGQKGLETGLLIVGTKDLNGRFDEIREVDMESRTSDLDDLLKDIHSIF